MMARTRVGWLVLGLVCATGTVVGARRIEADIQTRAERAMTRAGLSPSAVRADGRDLVLGSGALARPDRARARIMLGTIEGVRRVRDAEDDGR